MHGGQQSISVQEKSSPPASPTALPCASACNMWSWSRRNAHHPRQKKTAKFNFAVAPSRQQFLRGAPSPLTGCRCPEQGWSIGPVLGRGGGPLQACRSLGGAGLPPSEAPRSPWWQHSWGMTVPHSRGRWEAKQAPPMHRGGESESSSSSSLSDPELRLHQRKRAIHLRETPAVRKAGEPLPVRRWRQVPLGRKQAQSPSSSSSAPSRVILCPSTPK